MRLRLAHTLSLTLLAFAGVAVLALGGLTAWQLRNGFGDYLAARDVQHFERFVGILEARLDREGGAADLMAGRMAMRGLLDELNPRPEGSSGPSGPPGGAGASERPGRPGASGLLGMAPPRGQNPDAFPDRIQVLAPDGAVLLGPARIDRIDRSGRIGTGPVVERPVHAHGQVVALARMRPAPTVRTGAEARFLRDQYALMAAVGGGLIALALLTATWLARRWTRPLAAVQDATQRLAQGELTVRLPDGPALAGRSDEIGDVVRNVNRMAEGLQQLEGARRRWLADISHELRTPLTVLRGDIEALHDGVRPLQPQAIAVLHEEVLRLNRLVDDLHLLAISDLQALPCHLADDDAMALLQRLHRRYEARARAAGLSLRLDLPPGLQSPSGPVEPGVLAVHWDAGRIEQLLANLLENSLRYTQAPGQVHVRLQCLEQGHAALRVVVEDSAPGVPEAQLSQLFEPLYRGDMHRSGRPTGSGLGLAICQAIAKAHGGRLRASVSPLGGVRMALDLPLKPLPGAGTPQCQPAGHAA